MISAVSLAPSQVYVPEIFKFTDAPILSTSLLPASHVSSVLSDSYLLRKRRLLLGLCLPVYNTSSQKSWICLAFHSPIALMDVRRHSSQGNEMLHCKPSQIQLTPADVNELDERISNRRRAFFDVAKGKARLSTVPQLPTIILMMHWPGGTLYFLHPYSQTRREWS